MEYCVGDIHQLVVAGSLICYHSQLVCITDIEQIKKLIHSDPLGLSITRGDYRYLNTL